MKTITHNVRPASPAVAARDGERGYALLGLILTLSILSIYLVSSVVPNVKMEVQRHKEDELIYRGNQMAKAIARYYGGRILRPLQIQVPPPYGYLTQLKKLRDGVTLGVQEIKFARASEMIDPMSGVEWEPVRARDPRINNFLQAYAASTGGVIPPTYLLLAGPPVKKVKSSTSDNESASPRPVAPGQPGGVAGVRPPAKPKNPNDEDDDDDDDDEPEMNDPLAHLFKSDGGSSSSLSGIPIIGVAPKLKGKASRPLFGLENYEDWVFIYIPPTGFNGAPGAPVQQQQQPGGTLKVSP